MTMSVKALTTLDNHSTCLAGWGNSETGRSIYSWCVSLYLHRDGRWYTREFGGAAMAIDNQPQWITRNEAVDLIATEARDSITGYGYTREQAEIMVDGGDAGKGYREPTADEDDYSGEDEPEDGFDDDDDDGPIDGTPIGDED